MSVNICSGQPLASGLRVYVNGPGQEVPLSTAFKPSGLHLQATVTSSLPESGEVNIISRAGIGEESEFLPLCKMARAPLIEEKGALLFER